MKSIEDHMSFSVEIVIARRNETVGLAYGIPSAMDDLEVAFYIEVITIDFR